MKGKEKMHIKSLSECIIDEVKGDEIVIKFKLIK